MMQAKEDCQGNSCIPPDPVWNAHCQGGKKKKFSALTHGCLMDADDVPSRHGKVDCSTAFWTEWHCLYSPSLSLLLFQYTLAPPPFLCTFAGSINCTAQQCSPSAAADPAWALRIYVGWDFLKGNAASRVCVWVCTFSVYPPPGPPLSCTPIQTLLRIIIVKGSSLERPHPCPHLSIRFINFYITTKIALTNVFLHEGHILGCDIKLVKMSEISSKIKMLCIGKVYLRPTSHTWKISEWDTKVIERNRRLCTL